MEPISIYHDIEFGPGAREVDKETVYLTFFTEWRGAPARVEMQANRYRHSSGMSDWRIYAENAHETNADGTNRYGMNLTDTARSRLSDRLRGEVEKWLTSPAYRESRKVAFADALRNMARNLRAYADNPTHELREALARFGDEITNAARISLLKAADAFDDFSKVLYPNVVKV